MHHNGAIIAAAKNGIIFPTRINTPAPPCTREATLLMATLVVIRVKMIDYSTGTSDSVPTTIDVCDPHQTAESCP